METTTVNVPPAVRGVDIKWIVRGMIDSLLACSEVDETQNAYAHSIMIIRDRLWPGDRHGHGVRRSLETWTQWRANALTYGKVLAGTWDGHDFSWSERRRLVNAVLADLATYESHAEVAAWWLTFRVDI